LDKKILFGATVVSGTNRIPADPIFNNPASKDFSLGIGTTLIDKSIGILMLTKNFNQIVRDSKPDFAAIEYK